MLKICGKPVGNLTEVNNSTVAAAAAGIWNPHTVTKVKATVNKRPEVRASLPHDPSFIDRYNQLKGNLQDSSKYRSKFKYAIMEDPGKGLQWSQ